MYTGPRLMNQAEKPIKCMLRSGKEQGMHSTKQNVVEGALISIIQNIKDIILFSLVENLI